MCWKLIEKDRERLESGKIKIKSKTYYMATIREFRDIIKSGRDTYFVDSGVNELLNYYGVKTRTYKNGFIVVHM